MNVNEPLVSVRSVSKTFPGQRALDEMSIDLRAGEVHALLGQNGSGKSTLIKVLTGFYHPDPGAELLVGGQPGQFTRHGPVGRDGAHVRIRAVHQHLGLVEGLSIVDNVAMVTGYRRTRLGSIDWPQQVRFTEELLSGTGLRGIDVHTPVEQITPLQRTQVAIARAMDGWGESHGGILILDEPTATLPAEESEHLFAVIRDLRLRGVGIIYVSHRLDEIVELADVVTVLRDGRRISSSPMAGLGHAELVELMLGAEQAAAARSTTEGVRRPAVTTGEPSIVVRGLTGQTITELDFEVRRGEVLGFAGLVGSGCEELPYLLAGARAARGGRLEVGGDPIDAAQLSPRTAAALGLALVPADRAVEAIVPQFDLSRNMSLPRLRHFSRSGWLRQSDERAEARSWVDRLSVAPGEIDMQVTDLSGGNQQKVVLARWLPVATAGVILAEPTAGVDIGAKALIYRLLRAEAAAGLPLIVCSTDNLDLEQLCTRIIVLDAGRAVAELVGDQITEDNITHAVLTATEVMQ